MGTIAKAYYLYVAIGFIVLIPVMIREVFVLGIPKIVLLIAIPGYLVLSLGFYQLFKNTKSK
jgi:hypothetical protein